ncbi:hypothetical protein BC939DRAFT_499869 [Gamsiella multidivaricata]|uniref:uncharacterized protein n=1 Tax=Gamsiella multidivaricata TaxID=101098 RepID=UPI00221F4D83|nr:uncharacterized protein BC939DRAFT_499869 [Gamsiella multidivaricata]KAG0369148.1 DNA-binding transcription factor yap1 [Gamsiella multidivaricata]KAI7829742.1 hypothetical protein BC939DRAFT_499869 [Gamsiella multidivaricata]
MSLQQQQPLSAYPVNLTDSDWAKMLQDNKDAQDLLSNAIAHHQEHYRVDEDQTKRFSNQLHHKSDHYGDSKGSNGEGLHYSEGDNSSDEANMQADGKPAPKKAGRKPLTTEPTNKRKAQNRAAQRAFRERKERYVKSLEDRIKELEEMEPKSDSKLAEENMNLKVLVQKLETENYFLKEQSFTFDFPISQPGLYNLAKSQGDTAAATTQMATTQIQSLPRNQETGQQQRLSPSSVAVSNLGLIQKPSSSVVSGRSKLVGSDRLPWTPPSSGGDSVPNSPLDHDLPTPEQDSISQVSYSDSAGIVPRYRNGTPENMALFSSLLDRVGNTYNNNNNNNSILNHSNIHNNSNISSNSNSINSTTNINNISSIRSPASTISGHSPGSNAVFGATNNLSLTSSPLGNKMHHSNLDSPASTLALFSDNSPSPTLEDIVNTPLFETDKDGHVHFTPPAAPMSMPSLTYEQTQALFTDFRDPSDPRDFFTGFDDPVETLFSDQLLDYTETFAGTGASATTSMGTATVPIVAKEDPQLPDDEDCKKHTLPPLTEGEKAIPCPQAWEYIAKHPNFDDADIDELCAELKKKAKCSGHGPVIPLSDVEQVMNKLNQE